LVFAANPKLKEVGAKTGWPGIKILWDSENKQIHFQGNFITHVYKIRNNFLYLLKFFLFRMATLLWFHHMTLTFLSCFIWPDFVIMFWTLMTIISWKPKKFWHQGR
jgi:hypothetical protein